METDLLSQGVTLMLAGMGTVFAFLTTLVIVMSLMSAVINRMQSSDSEAEVSAEEVAAIGAAIARYRRSK
jgi:oxaloacetate decarboxylase gamma subunit